MTGDEIVAAAFADFEGWIRRQPDEVQELDVIEQAARYAAEKEATQ